MTVERRAYMRTIKRSFIALTVIFLLILAGFSWVVHDVNQNSEQLVDLVAQNQELVKQNQKLADENQKRINEIQETRIQSCEKTYEGVREVFMPFFPEPPRTSEQLDNLAKFNKTIDDLKRGCVNQTGQG